MMTAEGFDDGIENPPPSVTALTEELEFVAARVGNLITLRNDNVISQCIKTTGIWAGRDIALFNRLVKPGMFVADIGANIGHHTVAFSRLVGHDGIVAAFEPQRFIFRILNANLALNLCSNTFAFDCALGAEPGEVKMWPIDYATKDNFGAKSIAIHKGEYQLTHEGEVVPMTTADLMLSRFRSEGRKVDFIKLDVQAFELLVLQGATDILTRDRPILFLEISPYWMDRVGYQYREIYKLLESLGYRIADPYADNRSLVEREWSGDPNDEWDILAVPDSAP
jgi:FkbM family methyltransferase